MCDRAAKRMVPLICGVKPVRSSQDSSWPGIKLEHHNVDSLQIPEASTIAFLAGLCLSADSAAVMRTATNVVTVEPGGLVVVAPGKVQPRKFMGKIEFLLVELAPRYLAWAAEEVGCASHFEPGQSWQFRDEQLRHILLAMHHELFEGFPAGRVFGEHIGLSFASTFLAKLGAASLRVGTFRGGLSPARLRLVKGFVNDNLASSLRLSDFANLVQMGPCHFARAFKESTGLSPHQYVLRRRIDRAMEMIKEGRTSLAGIAYDVGFSSQGHFTAVFRKLTGSQPTSYREQLLSLKQVSDWHGGHFLHPPSCNQ